MKKILSSILILFFALSIFTPGIAATENLIIRVGYPQSGDHQYVGTVRIYESEATIDSIQKGDVFTIFMENAEFNGKPSLTERGRFDLDILSGGNDGDSYITYQFVDSSSGGTGRVIIDFILDDMRALGGDISARIDSPFGGVSSGYFSMGGSQDKEDLKDKDQIKEERIVISEEEIAGAREKGVNILVTSDDYQILLLSQEMPLKGSLQVDISREKSKDSQYLSELYSLNFTAEKDQKSPVQAEVRINAKELKEKNNIKAVQVSKDGQKNLTTYYDETTDLIYIKANQLDEKISLVRGSRGAELIFKSDEYLEYEAMKFAPVRKAAAWYGWEVAWNPFTRKVNLEKGDQSLEIEAKDYLIYKDRSYITSDFLKENFSAVSFELADKIVLKK